MNPDRLLSCQPLLPSYNIFCVCLRLQLNLIRALVILSNSPNSSNWTKIISFKQDLNMIIKFIFETTRPDE